MAGWWKNKTKNRKSSISWWAGILIFETCIETTNSTTYKIFHTFKKEIVNKKIYLSAADVVEKDAQLWDATNPDLFKIDKSYKGPIISIPLKASHVEAMIEYFKQNKVRLYL